MGKYVPLLLLFCFLLPAAQAQSYTVHYLRTDSASEPASPNLERKFTSPAEASAYINGLPTLLRSKGFVTASVDSVRYDSTEAFVTFYLGRQYRWALLRTHPQDEELLAALRWPAGQFRSTGFNFGLFQAWQQRILDYLEENGYPFGRIFLDSIFLEYDRVHALLQIERGPLFRIDSLRIHGEVNIRKELLERYLDLPRGSLYNKKKLEQISARIREIAYVEEQRPSSVSLLGTGAVVNLYLKPKRSSQLNALVGFLPNSNATAAQKFQVTGEANVLLRNSLGAGETIGLNWQQLQVKSPRLNLLYQHPFLFRSPFGLLFQFDMFRKDSSFLNLNLQFGTTYQVSANRSASLFLQRRQTILSGVDTALIVRTKRLPVQADVASSNLGVAYNWNTTNYRFNPQSGTEFSITGSAGTKKVRPNNQVLELNDAANPDFKFASLYDTVKLKTYQLRVIAAAARYFPTGKQTVLKTGVNAGLFQSGNYFLNELFQVGGYKLLRGFTEESEYLSHYLLGTVEYRYLIGLNSNFFGFVDGGWGRNALAQQNYGYIGTGLGLSLETRAGIFSLAWAIGKRNDTELNLRQSKVHLGFVNYF